MSDSTEPKIIPLIGDPLENLYHLGKKEREAFFKLEARVGRLLSRSAVLREGMGLLTRARMIFQKHEGSFFDQCLGAYVEGIGIEPARYKSFLTLIELAAHHGQAYPELKALLPGCTSVFENTSDGIIHSRLVDWPLLGIFDATPRLYYWKCSDREPLLNYSCEGLPLLFLQVIHASGASIALHHKPGTKWHKDGVSIFKISFDLLFSAKDAQEFRRELRKSVSHTKWGFYIASKDGQVSAADIDGPSFNMGTFELGPSTPLIFTNIPLQVDGNESAHFLRFCHDRQAWLKDKLARRRENSLLDVLTDVEDQKKSKWLHPAATLSTIGAIEINLTQGTLSLKNGEAPLVRADATVKFNLGKQGEGEVIKGPKPLSEFEQSWKHAGKAQAAFDDGKLDEAYHHLQMARALNPHEVWQQILDFYLCVWDFMLVSNKRELSMVYKRLKKLTVPDIIKEQWTLQCMRLEKKLGLMLTVSEKELGAEAMNLFRTEQEATLAVFSAWMKLIYPRLEILEIFSPHKR